MRYRRCDKIITLAAACLLTASLAVAQEKLNFDIPSQDASTAIQTWAVQSGLQVFAADELLRGVRTNTIHGEYSALQALQMLVAGTGLEVVWTGEKTVTIRRPAAETQSVTGSPEAQNAANLEEVTVTGSRIKRAGFDTLQAGLVNDSEQIRKRGYTNLAQALNDTPGFAASGTDPINRNQDQLTAGQSFVDLFGLGAQRTLTLVNGRRFVSSNTVSGGRGASSPGDQVDLNVIPVGLVDRIEIIAIGGAPVYGSDAIAGTVNIILKKNFQGLQTDLQYGNSEMGDTQGYTARVLAGTNFFDNRGNVTLSVEYNKQDGIILGDRAGLPLALGNPNPPPQRLVIPDFVYSSLSEGGIPYNLATFGPTNGYITSNGTPTGTPLQFAKGGQLVPFRPAPDLSGAGFDVYANGGDGVRAADHINLLTPTERTVVTGLAHYDLTPAFGVFAEGSYAHTEGTKLTDFAAIASPVLTGTFLTLDANNAFLSATTRSTLARNGVTGPFIAARNFSDLLDASGLATSTLELYRGVFGLQGNFDSFGEKMSWDVSYNVGQSRSSSKTRYINDTRFQTAIDAVTGPSGNIVCASGGNCVPLDVFGANAFSSAAAQYVLDNGDAISENTQRVATADLTGHVPFGIGGAEHIPFNLGAEYRKEGGSFEPNAVLQAGSSLLGVPLASPYVATSGGFNTKEVYTEVVTPLVSASQNIPGIKILEIEGAARYVDNSIAGGDTTWSAGARFAPRLSGWGDGLLFRGVYTHAIRAPAITELFAGAVPARDRIDDPCDRSLYNQGPNPTVRAANCAKALAALGYASPADFRSTTARLTALGTVSGNPHLKNEKANSWSVGFVYQPAELPKFRISADWSDIHLTDGIESLSISSLVASCYDNPQFPNASSCADFRRLTPAELASNPARVAGDVADGYTSGYVNTSSLRFTGLIVATELGFDVQDLVSSWKNSGAIRVGTKLFYRGKYELETDVGAPVVNQVGSASFPRFSDQLNLYYTVNRFDALLQALWTSAVKVHQTLGSDAIPDVYNNISGYWKFNGTLGVEFLDNFHAQLVVNNVFNKKPTVAELLSSNFGTYDIIGRSYSLLVSAKF
jgi:iron complex outermembrane receptor protein